MSGESVSECKLLNELRVMELKQELDKRNLDKNGIKIILADRLEKALRAEGHDPETYEFHVNELATNVTSAASSQNESKEEEQQTSDKEQKSHPSTEAEPSKDDLDVPDQIPSPASPDDCSSSTRDLIEKIQEAKKNGLEMEDGAGFEEGVAAEAGQSVSQPPLTSNATGIIVTVGDKKEKEEKDRDVCSRSVWVRGLTLAIKAADLKTLFSEHAKVVRAKIFKTKRLSGPQQCYGYVTLAEVAGADKCVAELNKKQWKGRALLVEKADKSKIPLGRSVTIAAHALQKETPAVKQTEDAGNVPEAHKEDITEQPSTVHEEPKTEKVVVRDREKEHPRIKEVAPRRENERGNRAVLEGRREVRQPARDPRRDAQRSISGPRRFPTSSSLHGHRNMGFRSSGSLSARVTRPVPASTRRPEVWDRREMMEMMRRQEEQHRRIEQDLELERERERIRFEREKIEREKLELQLQVALQQQQLEALASTRKAAEFVSPSLPTSKSRHSDERRVHSSRDRDIRDSRDKSSSSTLRSSRTSSSSDSRRGTSSSHGSSGSRSDRVSSSRTERSRPTSHSIHSGSDRNRSRSEYSSSRHGPTSGAYSAGGKTYDRPPAFGSSTARDTGASMSSTYYSSRDAYNGGARDAGFSSSSSSRQPGAWGSGGTSSFGSNSAWGSSGGATASGGSSWSANSRGDAWPSYGSTSGTAPSSSRIDYNKYERRF